QPKPKGKRDKNKKVSINSEEDLRKFKVNSFVQPTWDTAKSYGSTGQRARIRAAQIKLSLENNLIPSCFMGAGTLPRYCLPLSDEMATLIQTQGKYRARLAMQELLQQAEDLENKYFATIKLIKEQYILEGDRNAQKALRSLSQTLDQYRVSEKAKVQAIYDRELRRKPTSKDELGELMAKPLTTQSVRGSSDTRAATRPPKRDNRRRRESNQRQRRNDTPPRSNSRGRRQSKSPRPQRKGKQPKGNDRRGRGRGRDKPRHRKPSPDSDDYTAKDLARAMAYLRKR
ncbi:MAG: hypothetical protein GY706_15770, partial [Bacteroides sp.]|nr:hypothetical protein [Bacteroides sp.]